jgi:CRISPR-associated protein Cmr6
MPLPLYRQEEHKRDPFIKQQIHAGNTGLRYNKYFTLWDSDWTIKDGDKSKWIKKICERPAGDRKLLAETSARLISLTDHLGGEFRCYKTIWHFVSGLGLNNPVENGMAWHHTLGVPYLPGSSVKGLVRAWVEQWLEHSSQDEINRIFGPRGTEKVQGDNKAMRAVGNIIFFDALPTAPVRLAADVMTPHYQKYYGGTGPPGDWLDPNPIPFLTVDKEQVFLFAVAPGKETTWQTDPTWKRFFSGWNSLWKISARGQKLQPAMAALRDLLIRKAGLNQPYSSVKKKRPGRLHQFPCI